MINNKYFRSIKIPFSVGQNNAIFNLTLPSGDIKYLQMQASGIHKPNQGANGVLYEVNINNMLESPLYIHSSKDSTFKDIFDGFLITCPHITNNNINVSISPAADQEIHLILYFIFHY
jgi:hypothetical protein